MDAGDDGHRSNNNNKDNNSDSEEITNPASSDQSIHKALRYFTISYSCIGMEGSDQVFSTIL